MVVSTCGSVQTKKTVTFGHCQYQQVSDPSVSLFRYLVSSLLYAFSAFHNFVYKVLGDHKSGKPGNVREFETCRGNVRDVVNSQGNVSEKILS